MEKIDDKQIINLLCSPDLLQYLPNKDKSELCQCSKYMFFKCAQDRLQSIELFLYQLTDRRTIFSPSNHTNKEILHNQLIHISPVIEAYKNIAIKLGIGMNYNYHMVKYTTQSFINLTKLRLVYVFIPKFEFNNILNNLRYLDTLWLDEIILSFSDTEENTQLAFPPLLNNLFWSNCKQINSDSEIDLHPVALHNSLSDINFDLLSPLEIPTDAIKNLKFLTSYNTEHRYTQTINQLIQTNPKLSQLSTLIEAVDNTTIKLISQSVNLTKLHFNNDYGESDVQMTNFLTMPYLKSIEFDIVPIHRLIYVSQLTKYCVNLTSLKCPWLPETEGDLQDLIANLKHLEYLTLHNCSNSSDFIAFKLINKSLKHLEFNRFNPLKIDFKLFSSLENLSRVKIVIHARFHRNLTEIKDYYESLIGWRSFIYEHAIHCWKK
jgi:hypothetical protein